MDEGDKGGGEIKSNDGWREDPEVKVMDREVRIRVIMARKVNQVIAGYMKAEICGVMRLKQWMRRQE